MTSTSTPEPGSTRQALAVVYLSFVVRYASLLVLLPFYTRVLGPAEYGQVLAAMALYGIVWAVVNWGYSPVGTRELASQAQDRVSYRRELSRHLGARLMLVPPGLLIGAIGTFASPLLRAEPWVGVLATASGLVAAFNLGWFYQALQRFKTSAGLEITGFVLQLALVLWVVREPDDGVLVLAVLLLSLCIPALIAHAVAWRLAGGFTVVFDWSLTRTAMPVFAVLNVASMSLLLTTYLLSLWADAEVVGWFGTAERIASVFVAAMAPAAQVLLGAVSRRLAHPGDKDGHHAAHRLMALGVAGLTTFGFGCMVVVFATAPWVVPLALGDSFKPSAEMLQMLSLFLPFAAFVQAVSMYVLIPSQRESSALVCVTLGATIGLTVLCSVAPFHPGAAAVGSRLAAEVLTALAVAYMLVRFNLAGPLIRSLRTR